MRSLRLLSLLVLLPVAATPVGAQQFVPKSTFTGIMEIQKRYILRLIDVAHDSMLGFRPTPGVRTFAEQIEHAAGSDAFIAHLIITGGVNVYPKEVELVLETHPEVQEVAVVGLADPEYGQRVVAVVAGDPGTVRAGLADELIAYCRDRLSGIKCPRSVLFMAELPRNENGKLLKRLLRERLEAGQGIPSA